MENQLFKKFLTYFYGSLLGAIIGFVTVMITTRVLEPSEYGKASMFTLFLSLSMMFVIFGTDQAFVRFFYQENEEKRGGLLYNCLKISMVFLIPFLIIILIFRKEVSYLLFGEYQHLIIVFLILGVFFQVVQRFGLLIIRMQQKGRIYSFIEIMNRTLILIGVIVLYFWIGPTFKILIFSTVISSGVLLFYIILSEKKFWFFSNVNIGKLKHEKWEIFQYGYPLVLTMMLTWVFEAFDKLALRQWSTFEELGLYSAAFKIIALLTILKAAFTTFWVPVAYERFEKNPEDKDFYTDISKLVSYIMFSVAIFVIMFKDIIIFLLGKEYEDSGTMLAFLVFVPVMYTISETTVLGINFFKKVKWHILISLVVCIANIFGNWLLVPTYGGNGAAISTAVCYVLFFFLRTIISSKYFKINYGLYKISFSIVIIFLYASYTITNPSLANQLFIGFMSLILLALIYKKTVYKNVKFLMNFSFKL